MVRFISTLRSNLAARNALGAKVQLNPDCCFGIACPLHGTCELYAAVEGEHETEPIDTCMNGTEFPLYKRLEK
jgi:hypothetical protein